MWQGFTRELFLALAPPFPPFRLLRFDGCHRGNEVHLELGAGPLRQRWTSLITNHGTTPEPIIKRLAKENIKAPLAGKKAYCYVCARD